MMKCRLASKSRKKYLLFTIIIFAVISESACSPRDLLRKLTRRIRNSSVISKLNFSKVRRFFRNATNNICSILEKGVSFNAFNVEFQFEITNSDEGLFNKDSTFHIHKSNQIKTESLESAVPKTYKGYLKNHPNSKVLITCSLNLFSGIVRHYGRNYIFESYNHILDPFLAVKDIIVYDVCQGSHSELCKIIHNGLQRPTWKSYKISAKKEEQYEDKVCTIEIIADHTFYEKRNRDVNEVLSEMFLGVQLANQRISTITRDKLNLIVKRTVVFKDSSYSKESVNGTLELNPLFESHNMSNQTEEYCLSVIFTSQAFQSGEFSQVIKKTSKESKDGALSKSFTNGTHITQENTVVISNVDKNGQLLRTMTSLLASRMISNTLEKRQLSKGKTCSSEKNECVVGNKRTRGIYEIFENSFSRAKKYLKDKGSLFASDEKK